MAALRFPLPLSLPAQAVVTGSGAALLLGVTAASLFLFATDLATREPHSATGRQLRIAVVHPRPAIPAAPRRIFVREAPPQATIVQATARSMADRSARGPLVEAADDRPAPPATMMRVAPPPAAEPVRPAVRPGRPTDALAQARREWEARQARGGDRPAYEDEADYDPRDYAPPPRARRNAPPYGQDYGRGYEPPPQARYADPYGEADRYADPYDPDPYRRRR